MSDNSQEIADKLRRLGLAGAAKEFDSDGTADKQAASPTAGEPGDNRVILPPHYARLKRHSAADPTISIGASGTGKTFAVHHLATELGAKLYVQQAHRTLDVEEVRGSRGLNPQGTFFEPGVLTRSLQDPLGWYFLDEINMADAGVISVIHNLLDGTRQLTIPETGEVLRVPPNWRFFAACNPQYAGTQPINEALISRCTVIEARYYESNDEAALITMRYPEFPPEDAKTIVKLAHAVRAARTNGDHRFDFCLRTCWQLCREWMACRDPLEAFTQIVLPKVGDELLFGDVRAALKEAGATILSEAI